VERARDGKGAEHIKVIAAGAGTGNIGRAGREITQCYYLQEIVRRRKQVSYSIGTWRRDCTRICGLRPKRGLLQFTAWFKEATVKRELILSAAILSFLAVAPAYAQEQEKEKPQEAKPAQTENEHKPVDTKKAPKQQTQAPKNEQQSKEQPKQDEKSAKQQQTQKDQQPRKEQQKQDEKSAKQQQQTQKQQDQAAKQQKEQEKTQQGVAKQQQQEEKKNKEQKQVAKQQEQESRNQRAGSEQRDNGGQRGQRIPDDRFRAHFGHEHHFRVSVHERNHFSYGGYVFEFVDPWPVYWSYDDDCYIEEIGGAYYLFDIAHPGVRILVIVVG
jgi:hypothetical protein